MDPSESSRWRFPLSHTAMQLAPHGVVAGLNRSDLLHQSELHAARGFSGEWALYCWPNVRITESGPIPLPLVRAAPMPRSQRTPRKHALSIP
jgi:hypothetical protein